MPYDIQKDKSKIRKRLVAHFGKRVGAAKVRQWMHVFNSILQRTGNERRAFAGAWSVLNDVVGKKSTSESTAHLLGAVVLLRG